MASLKDIRARMCDHRDYGLDADIITALREDKELWELLKAEVETDQLFDKLKGIKSSGNRNWESFPEVVSLSYIKGPIMGGNHTHRGQDKFIISFEGGSHDVNRSPIFDDDIEIEIKGDWEQLGFREALQNLGAEI